jgi:hypothetical protein
MAYPERFELPLTVLETAVLPLTPRAYVWCQYLDLNQGPLGYQPSALNQLSYTDILVGADGNAPRALTSLPSGTDLQSAVGGNTL